MSQLPHPPTVRPRQSTPAWMVALCVLVPACESSHAEDSSPEANTPLSRIETALKGKPAPKPQVVERSIDELEPMPQAAFESLVANVQAETFNDIRAKLVLAAAKEHRLSSAQIGKLVASMPFSQTRIEVAQALYPSALDPARFGAEVLAATRFESEREVLRKWIEARAPQAAPTAPKKKR